MNVYVVRQQLGAVRPGVVEMRGIYRSDDCGTPRPINELSLATPNAAIRPIRALLIQPGNSRALARRAQAYQELGFFRLTVEDLEAAEASVSAEIRHLYRQGEEAGGERAEGHAGELAEVVKRLEHARWTKVGVVGWRVQSRGFGFKRCFLRVVGFRLYSFPEAFVKGRACCFAALVKR